MVNNVKTASKRRKSNIGEVKDNIDFFLLSLPGIILFIMFSYMPLYGIIVAFKDFKPLKGISGSNWVGFDNFKFFFTSQDAVRVTRNTILYNGTFIILGFIFPVILALMFYYLKNRFALKVYNTVVILPKFMSAVLISFIVYSILSSRYGVLNKMIVALGGEGIEWYSKVAAWPFILTTVQVWQTVGMGSVLYYATLMSIDESLFEAAKIDGANTLQVIWKICIPHLRTIITIQAILAVGGIFGGDFGLFYQVPRDQGVLYPVTDIIPTYVFRGLQSGSNRDISISAAVGLFQSFVGMLLVILTNKIVKHISPENSLF